MLEPRPARLKPGLIAILLIGSVAVVAEAQDNLRVNSGQPYLDPQETVRRFQLADGFEAKVFAAEPDVINPIAMCFDERGRMWVVESFEYPKGAPAGQRPRDRIKIYEDTDGDGRADKITLFTDGLNLATGIAVGHGGVFVGAAPDLLFIPIDSSGDKPAGPPQVLLTGFGREDTHELLNTFTWGPDGWLYGCHGVFTHSKVQPPDADKSVQPVELNAAVWRYHPRTHKFEIFAEGTSNPWGIDFDSRGNMFLTCCVIPHLFHMIPGGRYIRQAGSNKNPYDFGQLKEISDHTHHAESGWAHAGCVVLEGELWPEELRGSVIFGSIHGNSIKRDVLKPNGSTFTASHAPDFLKSGDKNFRPVNQLIGPDSAIYIIDWCDQWPCHQTPPDLWDKEHGRIFKIQRKGAKPSPPRDMGKLSDPKLLAELDSPNPYVYRTARRLIEERRAQGTDREVAELFTLVAGRDLSADPVLAIRTLWARFPYGRPGVVGVESLCLTPAVYGPELRMWAIRLAGERYGTQRGASDPEHLPEAEDTIVRGVLQRMVKQEPDPRVRLQLAASGQQFQREPYCELLQELALHDEDANDPAIPLMIWFAYEPHVVAHRDRTLEWLKANAAGHPIVHRDLLPRVIRRLVATGKPDDLAACVQFVAESDDDATARRAALDGLLIALEGRRVAAPAGWDAVGARLTNDRDAGIRSAVRRLGANFGDAAAVRELGLVALDAKRPAPERIDAVRSLAVAQLPESLATLEKLLGEDGPAELRREVLRALGGYDSPEIPKLVIGRWKSLPDPIRTDAQTLLTGRRDWSGALLDAIADGKLKHEDLAAPAAQRIAALKDAALTAKLEKVWGTVRAQTPAEIDALIKRYRKVVADGRDAIKATGNGSGAIGDAAAGRIVHEKKCGICHKFDGKGSDVGPDITGADRSVDYLIINILDPNRVVGAPYYQHVVATKSGRIITGKLVRDAADGITIQGENNKLDVIPKDEIDEHVAKPVSVMPEFLTKEISDDDFRNLIEYLRRK